jgi:hypothetical protein
MRRDFHEVLSPKKKLSLEPVSVSPTLDVTVSSVGMPMKQHCRAGGEKKRRWCLRVARLAEERETVQRHRGGVAWFIGGGLKDVFGLHCCIH